MTNIKFEKLPNFQVRITAAPDIISTIHSYAMIVETVSSYNWKTKRHEKEDVDFFFTEKTSDSVLTCMQGIAKLLIDQINNSMLTFLNIENSDITIELDDDLNRRFGFTESKRIKLSDKWKEIFRNNPKGKERAKWQLEDSETILKSNYGLVSLFTGYGKGEMLLSVSECYTEQFENNCAIFVFNNAVRDEIILRAKQYGIKLGKKFDPSKRLNIINPAAFVRSNASKTEEALEWLLNVDIIIADEAHHFSAPSWQKLLCICDPEFCYGYSATADINSGESFNKFSMKFSSCTKQMLSTFAATGYFLVERELPVPIKILRKKTSITTQKEVDYITTYKPTYLIEMVNSFIADPQFAKDVAEVYKSKLSSGICFIPITTVESGLSLTRSLNKLGVRTVFWSGELAAVPGNDGSTHTANESLDLDVLKELSKDRVFDILITTIAGVEGIDLANLNSLIPMTGKSYRMIIQPIGRSGRGDECTIVCWWDENNYILNSQMSAKYRMIKNRLNVISNKSI